MMDAAAIPQGIPERVSTLDTSSAALAGMGLVKMARSLQEIFDVVAVGMRRGRADMSLTEIRDLYEEINHKRIDLNRVSARVSNLIAAKRLSRKPDTRPCAISGKPVHPVYIPPSQPRLFA